MSFIKIEDLTYIYSKGTPFEKIALNNIDFEINEGDFLGIIGHTGCGKSTLIQHFNGILSPYSGKVFIDGIDINEDKKNLKKVRFKVGIAFQYPEYQLFEETVFKDISFGPKNMGLDETQIKERVLDACEFVGIGDEILGKSPFELSGGQKRRVAIAGVIAMRPKVLILDEPTAGLDPKGRKQILDRIKDYHKKTNNTIILVSHSMEDIASYTKNLLVLNHSEIYMYNKTDEIFSKSDKLINIGLSIPQISKIFLMLREKGLDINTNIFTVDQAKDYIISLVKGDKSC